MKQSRGSYFTVLVTMQVEQFLKTNEMTRKQLADLLGIAPSSLTRRMTLGAWQYTDLDDLVRLGILNRQWFDLYARVIRKANDS